RLRVVTLYLPRLVERTGDLEALTWHFIDAFNAEGGRMVHAIAADAWEAMEAYAWPGNIRELRNNLEAAFVLGEGPVLQLDELAPELHARTHTEESPAAEPIAMPTPTLQDLEREELVEAYRTTGGHRGKMAERLGISRPTLYRRLKKHGLT
ncbi:MAG: sigma-54-dependent Fis family transcriptional regulator, partial [Myxococcales bacterium]|nr:sigma-54-dependent Fis family transcriptional regulator [Myxococcales bacterium]